MSDPLLRSPSPDPEHRAGPGEARPPAVPDGMWCAIPVYNHGGSVVRVARACMAWIPRVVVIDDGSTDLDVAGRLAGSGITVLRHTTRRGKGAALQTALAHIAAQGGRWMITLDADGQHNPDELPRFFAVVAAEPDAVVLGLRDLQGPETPGSCRVRRAVSNFWLLMETGLAIPDAASGFRAYPVDLVTQLPLRTRHFDFDLEVLVRAAWAGLPLRSVPVRARFADNPTRASHFELWRDHLRMAWLHARLIVRRIAPYPIRRLVAPPPAAGLFRSPRTFWQRLLKSNATPTGLGVSAGLGVLLGALPLPGVHSLLILAVTLRLHLNPAMALVSQNLCIPPFVPVLCIQVGHYVLYREWLVDFTFRTWVSQAGVRLLEWGVGALLLGPLLGAVTGYVTYSILRAMRSRGT